VAARLSARQTWAKIAVFMIASARFRISASKEIMKTAIL